MYMEHYRFIFRYDTFTISLKFRIVSLAHICTYFIQMMYILNLVGTTVETSFSVVLYVEIQKSSFIVPPVQNLGKSYTLMTYWDETVHSSETWFVISAPVDSTSVYLDSAHVKRFSPSFHKTWLHQGDVFQFDLTEGESVFVRCRFDLSGIIINGSEALFVAMGAMDKDGEFVSVQLPSDKWGQRFLIDDVGPINIWGKKH